MLEISVQEIRDKKMIQYLFNLGLSISYNKVMKIENCLGNMIVEKRNSNEGVCIPDCLTQNSCPHFVIDNIDFENDRQMAKVKFREPLKPFFTKNKIKKKKA